MAMVRLSESQLSGSHLALARGSVGWSIVFNLKTQKWWIGYPGQGTPGFGCDPRLVGAYAGGNLFLSH